MVCLIDQQMQVTSYDIRSRVTFEKCLYGYHQNQELRVDRCFEERRIVEIKRQAMTVVEFMRVCGGIIENLREAARAACEDYFGQTNGGESRGRFRFENH